MLAFTSSRGNDAARKLQGPGSVALHYYKTFEHNGHGPQSRLRNFGDDINPWFLPRLFKAELIESERVCLVGIGTILNDHNAAQVAHFDRKVVFSSGVGYGDIGSSYDNSWDFVCVRGPRSAETLGLPPEVGICDGAVLLGDLYPARPLSERDGVVFIPHVRTGAVCGIGLRRICQDLSIGYLSPDAPFETFIETIRAARLVITEAMHGAIMADALRTPWVPVEFLYHHRFKWQDWFDSIELPYEHRVMRPLFWDRGRSGSMSARAVARTFYQRLLLKQARARRALRAILEEAEPRLSADSVLADRKQRLMDRASYINDTYAG
jgi:succinoglycan biosynthesis protein ExoV